MSKKTENAKQRHVPYKAFKLAMAGKGLTLRDVAVSMAGQSVKATGTLALPGASKGAPQSASYKGNLVLNGQSLDGSIDARLTGRTTVNADLRATMLDLERIGDEASKVARRAIQLCEEGESPRGYVEVRHIGSQVQKMVQEALDAFARFDADLALSVAQYDKTVDREYKTALRELVTYMMEDPRAISRVLNIIWALRSLERIGDHARNIAELVIYLVRGTDVRHIGLTRMKEEVENNRGE